MVTVSCRFAHSFKIMHIPQPIILYCAPPQPVIILWSGRDDVIEVLYIHCLNGWVPEAFELWALVDDGVREVHLYTMFNLRSEFREDTFQNFIYNSRRFQISVLGP